ncbi:MAG: DNRLRE domain-containing protein [gamma proteobacterium endosymbiont of Lamellibrachia anaximandri]|nr:DNRLRE domain-containing protein [gamma proteobacterium endosymbiont of Lamellibrachia anaximandri]
MTRMAQQSGYILLPVMLAITLVAAIAFSMNYESASETNAVSSELEADQARYLAEAGLNHARWQLEQAGCGPFSDLAGQAFGNHSYSATITPNNAGGTITAYNVSIIADAMIKSDTATTNYGGDAQLSTYFNFIPSSTQRTLYRFDIENAGIPVGAVVVSAVAKIFVVDSNDSASVTAHQITADWTEGAVNWDNINTSHDSTSLASIPSGSPVGEYVSVNITSLVQGWINGSTANQGIMLKTTSIGDLAQFTSQEHGNIDQRPLLEVKIADGSLSNRADISVQGTLANGVTRSVTRENLVLYQATPSTLELQPDTTEGKDAYIYEWQSDWNYGADVNLVAAHQASAVRHALLRFNIGAIPAGAKVTSANLELHSNATSWASTTIDVHRLNNDWVEGIAIGGTGPGANWTERDSAVAWNSAGGDYETNSAASAVTSGDVGWVTWDVTDLVNDWVSGETPNYGLLLAPTVDYQGAEFDSSDATDPTTHPKLTITYTCECGVACLAPQGSGNVLLVAGDAVNLDSGDEYKRSLFEDWGYTVTLIDDDENQAAFDTAFTNNDVVYVSETAYGSTLGDKLNAAIIGVVNEEGDLTDNLGTSSSRSYSVGRNLTILDNSHYITELFPLSSMPIYSADMDGLSAAGTFATDLQNLADWGGAPGLAFVEIGGVLSDGSSTAPGRRVMLPIGRDSTSNFNWNYLNNNGRLIVQRAIQWGTGGAGICSDKQMLEIPVIASHDDGEEPLSADQPVLASDDLELANTSDGDQVVGIRFQNITIPRGSEITEAFIDFTVDEITSGSTNLTINGEATDNTVEFAWTYHNIIDRPTTSASVAWDDVPSWDKVGEVQSTPDIASVVQEIVNRDGWSSGNALVTLIRGTGTRIPESFDGLPSGAPKLRVTFCPSAESPPTGQVAHWQLDELSGTTAVDSVGGHDGTLTNGPVWVTGQVDGALRFDGSNDYINVPHDDILSLTETMTFVAWVNVPLFGPSYKVIINKDAGGAGSNFWFGTWRQELEFGFYSGGVFYSVYTTGLSLQAGIWYQLAASFDNASDQVRLYVNGTEAHTDTLTQSPSAVSADAEIGRSPDGEYWRGLLDDVRIYESVLPASEIADLYTSGGGGTGGGGTGDVDSSCSGTFIDLFGSRDFAGNDGTLSWAGDWQEVGESDGPIRGDIRVDTDQSDYQLQIRDNDNGGEGVERVADLSGATTALLSFDYRRVDLDENINDYVAVYLSSSGPAGPWTELDRIGTSNDESYRSYSKDISSYISANTAIRLLSSPSMGRDDSVWFDNIQIQCGTE